MVLATCIQLWRPTTAWAFGVITKLTGDEDGYGYGDSIAAFGYWIFVSQQQPFKTFVYHLTSQGWVETQQLPFISGHSSYAMAGGELYVGHPYDDTVGQDVGAIARYGLSGDQWVVQETIYPMGSEAGEMFGITVAVEGDSMMVGASQSGAGALYVFDRVGGVWTQQQRLVPSDGVSGASFGFTFAREGADVLVGAPTQDGGGAVYVFQEQGGQWVETQKLVGGTYNFGGRLVRDGDTAAVGAAMESHVVERQGGTWSVVATIAGGGAWALEGDLAVLAGQVVRRTSAGWVPIAELSLKNGIDGCSATLVDGWLYTTGAESEYVDLAGDTRVYVQRSTACGASASLTNTLLHYVTIGCAWVASADAGHLVLGTDPAGGPAYVLVVSLTDPPAPPAVSAVGQACQGECEMCSCKHGICCEGGCDPDNECLTCAVSQGASADGVCGPRTDGTTCDPDEACQVDGTCQAGSCTGGQPMTCPVLGGCQVSECLLATGECMPRPAPDGTACGLGRYCYSGACLEPTPLPPPTPEVEDPPTADAGCSCGTAPTDKRAGGGWRWLLVAVAAVYARRRSLVEGRSFSSTGSNQLGLFFLQQFSWAGSTRGTSSTRARPSCSTTSNRTDIRLFSSMSPSTRA